MIDQAGFWQSDLLRRAQELQRRRHQKVWRDQSLGRLEQLVMVGFYCVRKLIESRKLSSQLLADTIRLDAFKPRSKSVTLLNWHRLHELYDFEQVNVTNISLVDLCHQFVHSYVFCPVFSTRGALSGILIASDRQKRKGLLHVRIKVIAGLFQRVGEDDTNHMVMTLNAKTGDYDVVRTVSAGRLTSGCS